ncbi:MAG: hypothetical protein P9M06_05010 [Candidatus Saelkia tenebricola]|nr:hypothetical protein [Candidatus Saelkia tenebricola]
MRKGKELILVLSNIFILGVCSFSSSARRAKTTCYPLEEYNVVGIELSEAKVNGSYSFPFPVSISQHHVAAYLWIKEMIAEGRLPKGLSLVYLDTHIDYMLSDNKPVQSSNWVRFALTDEICSEAILALPEWLEVDEHLYYRVTHVYDPASKIRMFYEHDLNVLSELESLSDGETLGPIILSIDCDYFSNMGYPNHRVSPREIREEIDKIVRILKEKNIQIAALNIAVSPGYTWLDQEIFIKDALLEAFSGVLK